jgi:uncharacterized protein YndB with AHSA1/START domain
MQKKENLSDKNVVRVSVNVNVPLKLAWEIFAEPDHIVNWNFATEEWHCPSATNDLRLNGSFSWRMEARDGSMGFDYAGKYNTVAEFEHIELSLDDGRKVWITFSEHDDQVEVAETFEIEDENAAEMQKIGWQNILNNYRSYAESIWNSKIPK